MAHAMEVLRDNVEPRIRKQMVDIGDATVQRILYWNDAEIRLARANGFDGVIECGLRNRHDGRQRFARREIGIGARLALEGDALCCRDQCGVRHVLLWVSRTRRASARSAGVSTLRGTLSTRATAIRMPASSARSCSSFSLCSRGEGSSRTKRSSAARANA